MNTIEARLARGAAAGAAATTAHTRVMLAAQKAGLVGRLPPELITEKALDALHLPRRRGTQELAAGGLHYGYGMVTGALYSTLVQGRIAPNDPLLEGALFGGLIWFASYQGWVPALRLLPPISRDRRGRQLALALAHVVFGAVVGLLARRR